MKIVFFGTSNVALPVLEALSRKHEILAVVTQPDSSVGRKREFAESPVSVLANEMKLKVLKPDTVKENGEFYEILKNLNADIFIVVSYGKILPLNIIDLPKYKTLNVHFSLLPKYRGASPIQAALINGDAETGTSIFILEEKMDTGPIIVWEKMPIDPDDNFLSLSQKLAMKSAELILPAVGAYVSGAVVPKPQDESLATYCSIISRADGKINWQKTAQEIYNQFRAFYPWPGVWTNWNNKLLKLTDIQIQTNLQIPSNAKPGTVLIGGVVACGQNTYLQIKTLQLEGKTETKILDFLNGYKEFTGSVLE